ISLDPAVEFAECVYAVPQAAEMLLQLLGGERCGARDLQWQRGLHGDRPRAQFEWFTGAAADAQIHALAAAGFDAARERLPEALVDLRVIGLPYAIADLDVSEI